MKSVHNICRRCTQKNTLRDVFCAVTFDKGSRTRCCFCGDLCEGPPGAYYTRIVLASDVLVCHDSDHEEEP